MANYVVSVLRVWRNRALSGRQWVARLECLPASMPTHFSISRCPRIAALMIVVPLALGLLMVYAQPASSRIQTLILDASPDGVVLDPRANVAIVGSYAGATVSLLDLAHMRLIGTVRVGDPSTLAPLAMVLDPATHRLFVVTRGEMALPGSRQVVQVLDSRTGARLAIVRVGRQVSALALDAHWGRVVVANEADGTIDMIDEHTLAVLRTTAVGFQPLALAVDARASHAFVLGPTLLGALAPWANNGAAAVLAMLDIRDGALLQRTLVSGGAAALALDARHGRVIVTGGRGGTMSMSLVDARDGALKRTVTLGGEPGAVAVDERRGRVFVVDALDGTLSVLDDRSGAVVRIVRVDDRSNWAHPAPYALAVDERRDRVYLTTWGALVPVLGRRLTLAGAGTLVVLDARTGTVLRRVGVGMAPQAVAVAASSGRVVVVNGGGEVVKQATTWLAQGAQRLQNWLPWFNRFVPRQALTDRVPGSVSLIELGA